MDTIDEFEVELIKTEGTPATDFHDVQHYKDLLEKFPKEQLKEIPIHIFS